MINRTLIRLKIVQLVYAYYQNEGKTLAVAEKELLHSLAKSYELYNYMLLLMVKVTGYARRQIEHQTELNLAAHADEEISHNFVENKFIEQLSENVQLMTYVEDHKLSWDNEIAYIKALYEKIQAEEFYKTYSALNEPTYEQDRELWRCIYRQVIAKDELLTDLIEDMSLYWNDDRAIVDSFVIKTIKMFEQEAGAEQNLLPDFKDSEDKEFAVRLFHQAIANSRYYQDLITESSRNWAADRMAFMDVVIMQIAIAELLSFPMIPTSVTVNEYVEISKYYSTPNSYRYINGLVDAIAKRLKHEHKLMKD